MAALGTTTANKVIGALLTDASFTLPTSWFLALYLTNPTASDTGTEISGVSYVRQPIIFGTPSGGSVSNTTDIAFPYAGSVWGNVVYAAILDASTGGNLLFFGPLVSPQYVGAGDVLKFLTGNVTATVS
jgi:hypothetical protein